MRRVPSRSEPGIRLERPISCDHDHMHECPEPGMSMLSEHAVIGRVGCQPAMQAARRSPRSFAVEGGRLAIRNGGSARVLAELGYH